MTTDDRLTAVLAATSPVLLDFDGPVTPILAQGENRRAADQMRATLHAHGVEQTQDVAETPDPLEVLRYTRRHGSLDVLEDVENEFRRCEVQAAGHAAATPGADEFLHACRETRRRVIVVSNNAAEAIDQYLRRHQLRSYVEEIIGRAHMHPELMKPHPTIVLSALTVLDTDPGRCVLIGDSVTDIEVAQATGVRSIGYVKRPERLAGLQQAGADATVDSMHELAAAIRAVSAVV